MSVDYDRYEQLGDEQRAAASDLDRILAERGLKGAAPLAILTTDHDALAAIDRLRGANARLSAFLDAAVPNVR